MLRAQVIRICNVDIKIWGFTPSSGAFSKWLSPRKCRKKIEVSVSQHLIITNLHNLSLDIFFWGWQIRWYYLKILYISKRTSQSMMAANFIANFIVISMKSTYMPVSILPKTKRFKVLYVCKVNYGVNNEKLEIHGLPGIFKMLTMEKRQKSKINHFRINKTPTLVLIGFFVCLFVCLFSYAITTQFGAMKWLGLRKGPKTRIGISMSRILIVIFLWYLHLSTCMVLGVRNLDKFVFTYIVPSLINVSKSKTTANHLQ